MIAEAFPGHLLPPEESSQLPGDNGRRCEPHQGVLIVSPRARSEFGYQETPAVRRVYETNEPFPVRTDLTEPPDGPARQHGEVNQ